MVELIDVEQVRKALGERLDNAGREGLEEVLATIPRVDAEPIVYAEWQYTRAEGGLYYWLCSNCRAAYHRKEPRDRVRCYNCGARMQKAR